MKKIILNLVLAALCLNFNVKAQTSTDPIKALSVGDTIPQAVWNTPLHLVNHPQGKKAMVLKDYKGKLIILDFWAKFCGSCIAAMPRMHQLQEQFKNDIVILNVTTDKTEIALNCLNTNPTLKPLHLFSIAGDRTLSMLFPHQTIPHYVWISKRGFYISQTESSLMTAANVTKILRGEIPNWQEKSDIDTRKPLFLGNQLPSDVNLKSYSILIEGKVSGLGSGHGSSYPYTQKQRDKYYKNLPLQQIYMLIARQIIKPDPEMRFIVELDTADAFFDVRKIFTFQYIGAPEQHDKLYTNALGALNTASGYFGRVEQRKLNTADSAFTSVFVISRQDPPLPSKQ